MVNFFRKPFIKRIIIFVIIKPVSFFLYPFIRFLFTIKHIRIGSLNSGRIGHFAANTELYLCEKDHGLHPKETNDIFGYTDVCNEQLLTMWKSVLNVKNYAHLLYVLISHGPNKNKLIAKSTKSGISGEDRDIFGLLEKYPAHLSFTSKEEEIALECLKKMGLSNIDSYVCIAARDPQYLQKTKPFKNWSYHDYRNSNINNYSSAARELINRGNYVIRLGTHIQDIMELDKTKYIEYYHNGYRTELMDIYLSANCKFFVSGGIGIDMIAYIFRRPLLYVNFVPIEYMNSFFSNSISIFKKHWLKNEKRFMTFKEIFEAGAGKFFWSDEFTKLGIELVENTKDEILEAVMEMDDRLNGTWKSNEEDDELQNRFWSIFPKNNKLHGEIKSRVGAAFLSQNKDLLF